MTEAELEVEVTDLIEQINKEAKAPGLVWHRCKDSRLCRGKPGLPDLVIAGTGGLSFRELKSDHGETDADQDTWAWLLQFSELPQPLVTRWGLWDPGHLTAGIIELQLRKLAGLL